MGYVVPGSVGDGARMLWENCSAAVIGVLAFKAWVVRPDWVIEVKFGGVKPSQPPSVLGLSGHVGLMKGGRWGAKPPQQPSTLWLSSQIGPILSSCRFGSI